MVKLVEKPINALVYYLLDENFVWCSGITRTNGKKFTAEIILKKKII